MKHNCLGQKLLTAVLFW